MKKHIDGLSAKGYEALEGVNSLDFVLMFVPVEAALQAALEFDDSLYHEAYDRCIVNGYLQNNTKCMAFRTTK